LPLIWREATRLPRVASPHENIARLRVRSSVQTHFLNRDGNSQMSNGAVGTQVGVSGCGKQTVYVLVDANHFEWIANREVSNR
jgi:hypothetical protein